MVRTCQIIVIQAVSYFKFIKQKSNKCNFTLYFLILLFIKQIQLIRQLSQSSSLDHESFEIQNLRQCLLKRLLSIFIKQRLSMRALKVIGILLFFVHYYVVLAVVFLKNAIIYLWKLLSQSTAQKDHVNPFSVTHSHVFATIQQVISYEGFAISTHHFQTADGATVSLWRIHKLNEQPTKQFPVLMMHGLLDCSASWFLHVDKSKSLPYILASRGYDVWVGNNRGNRVSRHEDDNCPRYWEYCFDHLIQYDQPTIINGVLRETGKQKVIYIGHSQGSTQFLLGLGLHSNLQHKIASFIGLGTVISLSHVNSHTILNALSKLFLLELYKSIGFKKILVLPKVLSRAVGVLLYNSNFHLKIMMGFIRLLCGFSNKNKIPESLFGVIITHEPGGSSVNNALHWVQCHRQGGVMRKFNYGPEKNIQMYGKEAPPAYCLLHLQDLPFNSYLFRGMSDTVISDGDFSNLKSKFHPQRVFTHEIHDYNHLDYVWSQSAHHDIYGRIVQIVQKPIN